MELKSMFTNTNGSASAPAARAVQPTAPKQAIPSGLIPSIISADLVVTGSLTSTGDIQIDGRVDGDVRSGGLVIGEKAEIHGDIAASDVTVRGHVRGRICAKKVFLCATSRVEGDILHDTFGVEVGASFEGNCRHSDGPAAAMAADAAKIGFSDGRAASAAKPLAK
jgi:cytoskeletal protein CcmA (bactofilin family)